MSYNWKLDAKNKAKYKKCLKCPFYDEDEIFEDGTFTLSCSYDSEVDRKPKGCPTK